jgi:hypothetical protein
MAGCTVDCEVRNVIDKEEFTGNGFSTEIT